MNETIMNNVQVLISIPIVGVIISILMEWLKANGTKPLTNKLLVVAFSLIAGTGIYLISGTSLWVPFIGVLGVSSTVYALFMK